MTLKDKLDKFTKKADKEAYLDKKLLKAGSAIDSLQAQIDMINAVMLEWSTEKNKL